MQGEVSESVAPSVVTIDGPSGTGKGTIAAIVAQKLGWHMLDSGALYRLTALAALNHAIDLKDKIRVAAVAENLDVEFVTGVDSQTIIKLEGQDVTNDIRTETAGNNASIIATIPEVRAALLNRQHAFLQKPGLIADGRDMGTVIFPDAILKIYLTASAEERASRRYKQLKGKGLNANIDSLSREISERDERDSNRAVAPLKPAEDAEILDTSDLTIEEVVESVFVLLQKYGLSESDWNELA
ncbi:MAG: (d)CMP kinase [Gammaproteobacteria bacterium]|nr:(d)CMP kinase [Gammaproteobacteria bacterium]